MSVENSVIKTLSKAIIEAVEKKISTASFDRTVSGRIVLRNEDNTYKVEYLKEIYTLKSNNSKVFSVNDVVWIMIPQNNFNNAFIM
jgi:hypothetical protein